MVRVMFMFLLVCVGGAHAEIAGVSGPASTAGSMAAVITAPSDVLNSCVSGSGQLGFNEALAVVTPVAFYADDAVVVPAGTLVDSHMIFLNGADGATSITHSDVVWSFKQPIIAVMSDPNGNLEADSTTVFGASGTNYTVSPSPNNAQCTGAAPFAARGLETTKATHPYTHTPCGYGNDCYTVDGSTIKVTMAVAQPGDWMRVLTRGAYRVGIDIKPGSDPNCVNINGHGVIPVAVLGSSAFDVSQVDVSTLNFAGLKVRVKGNGSRQCSIADTNNDGFDDLVCQFQDDTAAWKPGTTTAEATGSLIDGKLFEGSDSICIVP